MDYEDIATLSNLQAPHAQAAGVSGADLADPFRNERTQYQNQLRNLMSNPGAFASSPVYKFAFDQGLDALAKRSAASGRIGSSNYLNQLQKYGQDMASQQFFPQANLLAMLSGATTGSPAAAGLSYMRGTDRKQDLQQMAAAAKAAGRNTLPQNQTPWWMRDQNTGLPSGGYAPTPSSYGNYVYPGGGATPSYGSGTGYVESDFGMTNFGSGGGYTPYEQTSYDWQEPTYGGGYTPYGQNENDFLNTLDNSDKYSPVIYDYGSYDSGGWDSGGYDYYTEE